MTRWLIATAVFLTIGWLSFKYSHTAALIALLILLIIVAIFGGHGPRPGRARGQDGPIAPDGPPEAP